MKTHTRKPGEDFLLSDEEILVAPAKMLSRAQRVRRRSLKKQATIKREALRKKNGEARIIRCQGYKRNGEPCTNPTIKKVPGIKHCVAHLNDAEKVKLGKPTQSSFTKEGNTITANGTLVIRRTGPQLLAQWTEAAFDKLINRYAEALGVTWEIDEQGAIIITDNGSKAGLRLHGESKEGYINVSQHADLMAQIQVIEKLMDRSYGKPRQTTVLEGGSKPIQVLPVRNIERAKLVTSIIQRSGAVEMNHEARSRRQPSESGESDQPLRTGETSNVETAPETQPDNVVSILDSDK